MEDDDEFNPNGFDDEDLEHLIIMDKEYKRKKMIKHIIIFSSIFFSLLLIVIIIIIIITIKNMTYGKIECFYKTSTNNETIELINLFNIDKQFFLIIDENEYEQKTNHTFKMPGLHKVIFVFKKN